MVAISRWILFPITSTTLSSSGGATGYAGRARGTVQSDSALNANSITISSTATDLKVAFDGGSPYEMTLLSGTLDPRIIAQDVTYKLHTIGSGTAWQNAQCEFVNNKFRIYSGNFGASSTVALTVPAGGGPSDVRPSLNLDVVATTSGSNWTGSTNYHNNAGGIPVVSGTYTGQFDDIYTIICSDEETVGVDDFTTPTVAGVVTQDTGSYAGTSTIAGAWNESTVGGKSGEGTGNDTYTITVDVTNGVLMGQGTGNVPEMTATSAQSDNMSTAVELLYPDHWYEVGSNGLMIKFTDSPFTSGGNIFSVKCKAPDSATGASTTGNPGAAKFIYSSRRGESSVIADSGAIGATTTSVAGNAVGLKGLTFHWTVGTAMEAGDEWNIICRGPQPTNYSTAATNLNFGNVTVSTNSVVRNVWFELTSGAVQMTTCKFGLQSDGTFQHHDAGNADTELRFGTIGAGQPISGAWDGEYRASLAASELIAGTYTYSNNTDLAVVDSADDSETIGRYNTGIFSDFIFLCLKIGAAETGANSGINYRMYFDYS